jgi:hypothetical protein
MKTNVGGIDKIVRIVVGIALISWVAVRHCLLACSITVRPTAYLAATAAVAAKNSPY